MKPVLSNDISGVSLNRNNNQVYKLKISEKEALDLTLPVLSGKRSLHNKDSASETTIKLDGCANFVREFHACLPLPYMELVNRLYPLKLSRALEIEAGPYELFLKLDLGISDCEGFEPLYDTRRFEGAIDRSLYTRWGPGGFEYNYESGLDRRVEKVNGIDWIILDTRYRDPFHSQTNIQRIRTCYTVINQRYMLTIDFKIDGKIKKSILPIVHSFIDEVQRAFVADVYVVPNTYLKQEILEKRSSYSQQYRAEQPGPVAWLEAAVPSLPEDHSEIDDSDYDELNYISDEDDLDVMVADEFESTGTPDSSLVYSPYRPEDSDKVITPPWHLVENIPNGKVWLAECRQLIEQMKKTLASHVDFE